MMGFGPQRIERIKIKKFLKILLNLEKIYFDYNGKRIYRFNQKADDKIKSLHNMHGGDLINEVIAMELDPNFCILTRKVR